MLKEAKQFLVSEVGSTWEMLTEVQGIAEELWKGTFYHPKHPLLSALASRTVLGFLGLGAVGLEVGMLTIAQNPVHFSYYHQVANGVFEAWKFGQLGAGTAATVTLAETCIRWMQVKKEPTSELIVQSPEEQPDVSDLQSIF